MAFVLQKDAKTTLDGWLQSIIAVYEGSEKQTGYKYANSITHMKQSWKKMAGPGNQLEEWKRNFDAKIAIYLSNEPKNYVHPIMSTI